MQRLTRFGFLLVLAWLLAAATARADSDGFFPPDLPEPGFLGLSTRWEPGGALVLSVDTDGPADQAGLRPGDVIVAQANPLTPQRLEGLHSMPPGTRSILHVRRHGTAMTFRCTWDVLSPERRQRMERSLPHLTSLSGCVEVVSGRQVGIHLMAPAGGLPRLQTAKAHLQQGNIRLADLSFLRTHDDWRIVAEVPEGATLPKLHDVAVFVMSPPPRPITWGPNWTPPERPEPDPAPASRVPARRVQVPVSLLNEHLKVVRAHYKTLLAALPQEVRQIGQTVTLEIDHSPDLNAFARMDAQGRRSIVLTRGMSELLMLLGYIQAVLPEKTLESSLQEMDRMALVKALSEVREFTLPSGFLSRTRDSAFRRRMDACAAPMYTFVLGHELGHHLLAHEKNDSDLLGRMLSREQEKQADSLAARMVQATGGDKSSVLLFAGFMTRVENYQGAQYVPDYLQTHPDWRDRTSFLEGVFSTF